MTEGLSTAAAARPSRSAGSVWSLGPGLALAAALAAVATAVGGLVPVIGAPVLAIAGGVAVSFVRPPAEVFRPGLRLAAKRVLQAAIVLLGTGLSLHEVVTVGWSSLPVLLGTLAVALVGARVLGGALGIDTDLRTLVGVGTAICGASAIAAADTVIGATEADVSYAVTTIFTFNVAAVLLFPPLGRLLAMSPHTFGLWSGTAVNDMSSVVAAADSFGRGAGSYAVVVKLTRTLMIVPIVLGLSAWRARAAGTGGTGAAAGGRLARVKRLMPWFVGLFLLAVVARSVGAVPTAWQPHLSTVAGWFITMALGAIGLSTRPNDIRRTGLKPLALGAGLWVLVAGTSLALQAATGSLH